MPIRLRRPTEIGVRHLLHVMLRFGISGHTAALVHGLPGIVRRERLRQITIVADLEAISVCLRTVPDRTRYQPRKTLCGPGNQLHQSHRAFVRDRARIQPRMVLITASTSAGSESMSFGSFAYDAVQSVIRWLDRVEIRFAGCDGLSAEVCQAGGKTHSTPFPAVGESRST